MVSASILPTRIAAKYELSRKIGFGAMGEVWAARHVSLGEEVALKLVRRDVVHGDGSTAEGRFLLEARVASQLSRKTRHVVSVTDHGVDGAYAYLVMELLHGESLEARLARTGPLPLAKVVPLIHQLARALSVAHADGVVHRDLKPSNVLVTADEDGKALVKILDFGIAKVRRPEEQGKHTTLAGFLLGTPTSMSPEQARGEQVDHRADVWGMAVMAYHLLTGAYPFDGDTAEAVLARVCSTEAVPIATVRPDLPAVVTEIFTRAFAARIDHRFQSATAFAAALEQASTQRAPQAMGAISLPPPRATEAPTLLEIAPALPGKEASIIAAGVPRRRAIRTYLLGASVVVGVAAMTASTLAVYFQREAEPAVRANVGAPTMPTTLMREEIPPPALPSVRPADLPTAPTAPSPRTLSPAAHPAVLVAPRASVVVPAPTPVSQARAPDRSEVF